MSSRGVRDRSPPGLLASEADAGVLTVRRGGRENSPAGRENRTTEQAFMNSPG
ncbi:MAG: hypothetical protein HOO98_12075 [Nitrospira sp.]|nr:hypothetical protein [Nitrospira sp.]